MKKLLPVILCLFTLQCEQGWLEDIIDPTIEGCNISSACNYNPDVTKFDDSCEYASCMDCLGYPYGVALLDSCGTCDAAPQNDCAQDCSGTWGGVAVTDNCGNCSTSSSACELDCMGVWGGSAVVDACNVCGGDESSCKDCNGVINGSAYVDGCQICVGGNTGQTACTTEIDCAGVLGGTSYADNCGTCDSDSSNDCSQDCAGAWGGGAVVDVCNVCGGDNSDCTDCLGEVGGSATTDNCDTCDSDPVNDCGQDCNGDWGGSAILDNCGICGGDNSDCTDCLGVVGGTATMDQCGVCDDDPSNNCVEDCVVGESGWRNVKDGIGDGDDICMYYGYTHMVGFKNCFGSIFNYSTSEYPYDMEDCIHADNPSSDFVIIKEVLCSGCNEGTDCMNNTSDYCQDLSVLQKFIDNSLETIDMGMDDNGNGVIEPLELGTLVWENGRLTHINFYNKNGGNGIGIVGEIPSGLWNMTSLIELHLGNNANGGSNQISGEISPEIANLINLEKFSSHDTELTGIIPEEICTLGNLTQLWLENNPLSGIIPDCIGNLTNLTSLDLGGGLFTGEIPHSIGNLVNLSWLYLSCPYSNLTGEIPVEIGNLTNISTLVIFAPQLTGEIPSQIGNLTNLNWLSLGGDFTGEIPSEIGNLINLDRLSLSGQLTGEIPSEIGNLMELTSLTLGNQLSGEIPSEIGNLVNLTFLWLNNNQLSGEIPESICTIYTNTNITEFNISNNNLCPPYPDCLTEDDIGTQDISACPMQDCAGTWGGSTVEDCTGLCGGTTTGCSVYDVDGNGYTTVTIGTQEWLVQNLKTTKYNDGIDISTGYSGSDWANLSTGAYAVYDDNLSNADIYGNLYNWYTVDDSRGVCPDGWHVPSDDEWNILITFLDENTNPNITDSQSYIAGGMLKATGTIEGGDGLWYSPNEDATNESGFMALPGGFRFGGDNNYMNLGYRSSFWSSTIMTINYSSFKRGLSYNNSNVERYGQLYQSGLSVRCLKD